MIFMHARVSILTWFKFMQIITRHRQEKSAKKLQTHHHDHHHGQHNPHRSDEQSKTILIIIRMASIIIIIIIRMASIIIIIIIRMAAILIIIIIIILSKFISNGRRRRQPLAADGSVSSKWTLTASLLFTHHHYNTDQLLRIIVSSFTKAWHPLDLEGEEKDRTAQA